MNSNKIQLRPGLKVGESCAEDDLYFLNKCFVEKTQLSQLLDLNNNVSVILGRTGSGKTALLTKINSNKDIRVKQIDPATLFFQYVSNSKTFDFFVALDANLDVLFNLLWKHILLIESIKLYFETKNNLDRAMDFFRGKEKNLKNYLAKSNEDFWTNSEVSMQEIITKLEKSLEASAGIDVKKIRLGAKGAAKIGVDEKIQIRRNISAAINTPLASLLHKAIEDLNTLTLNKNFSFYIVLDELDENWMVSDYKYRLIRALLESIRKFRKVRKLKVIVAMRSDLYEKTIQDTLGIGHQSEKHNGLITRLEWNKEDLFSLIESRVEELFKWQYTKASVKFADIFPPNIRKQNTFQYIIERTLLRPRDLIEFVNSVLNKSSGSSVLGQSTNSTISAKRITDAEETYSANRKQAIIEEWVSVHPQLGLYIDIINALKQNFEFEDTNIDNRIDDLALNLCAQKDSLGDNVTLAAHRYLDANSPLHKNRLKQELFAILYKVGILSIKITKGSPYKNSFESNSYLTPTSIGLHTKFSIRPMFWRALGITPNIGK